MLEYHLKWHPKWRKPIEGYGRRYNVSFFGEVFSKPKKRGVNLADGESLGQYLKKAVHKNGYLTATLYKKDGKKTVPKRHYVHRLVAEAFVSNPHGFRFVHHIDGNKQNNHIHNLIWLSQSILKRKLQDGDKIPLLFGDFYEKVMKYHGANIQEHHKQGESVESLSDRYKVSKGWILEILEKKGLEPIVYSAEARKAALTKRRDDAFDRELMRLDKELKQREETYQRKQAMLDEWVKRPF